MRNGMPFSFMPAPLVLLGRTLGLFDPAIRCWLEALIPMRGIARRLFVWWV
jgi:hypothetical protein